MRDLLRKYRWHHAGMVAHWIQRFTGLLLLFYLFLHVRTIHKLSEGPQAFNEALAFFRNPLFKLGEIGLLAVVILHAMNGIRLTLHDMSVGQERQREWFWGWTVGVGLALFLAGAVPMFVFGVWKGSR